MKIFAALIMAATLTLSGCASNGGSGVGDGEVSAAERVALRAALRISTAVVIDRYAGISPAAVVGIVQDVRAYVDLDGRVTIEEVRGVLAVARDRYGLSAAEVVALDEIVTTARDNLAAGTGDVTARLGDVLDWIESAATIAQGGGGNQ